MDLDYTNTLSEKDLEQLQFMTKFKEFEKELDMQYENIKKLKASAKELKSMYNQDMIKIKKIRRTKENSSNTGFNKKFKLETESQRLRPANSEVDRLFADNSKARESLKWQPEFGGIEGFKLGLAKTIEWFSDPKNLGRYKHELYNI